MYLLVFVMLVIGLIGLYAQVLSLQAAKINDNLTALANTMIVWHAGAVSKAASDLNTSSTGGGGTTPPCSLTEVLGGTITGLENCDGLDASGVKTPEGGTVVDAAYKFTWIDTAGDLVHLPPGYDATNTQFNSILYTIGSDDYVVTYVPPAVISKTNPAPGYLSLPPSGNYISYTSTDLQHQLSISNLPTYAYGVVGGTDCALTDPPRPLLSPAYLSGQATFQYTVPPQVCPGSIAIVSLVPGY